MKGTRKNTRNKSVIVRRKQAASKQTAKNYSKAYKELSEYHTFSFRNRKSFTPQQKAAITKQQERMIAFKSFQRKGYSRYGTEAPQLQFVPIATEYERRKIGEVLNADDPSLAHMWQRRITNKGIWVKVPFTQVVTKFNYNRKLGAIEMKVGKNKILWAPIDRKMLATNPDKYLLQLSKKFKNPESVKFLNNGFEEKRGYENMKTLINVLKQRKKAVATSKKKAKKVFDRYGTDDIKEIGRILATEKDKRKQKTILSYIEDYYNQWSVDGIIGVSFWY